MRHYNHIEPAISLSFVVKPVETLEEARSCLNFRHSQYLQGDYNPKWQEDMKKPDFQDLELNSITLIAVCKTSKKITGTLRLTIHPGGESFLSSYFLKNNINYLEDFCYLDRFAISKEASPLTGLALMKASWMLVKSKKISFVFALVQRQFLKIYDRWGAFRLIGLKEGVLIPEFSQKPYYLIGLSSEGGEDRIKEKNPEFLKFYQTCHLDIHLSKESFKWAALLEKDLSC